MENRYYYIFTSPWHSLVYVIGTDTIENAIKYFSRSSARHKLDYQLSNAIPQSDAPNFDCECKYFEYL